MLAVEELNNIQKSAKKTIDMWSYIKKFEAGNFVNQNTCILNNYSYPFWSNNENSFEIVSYKGIVSAIEDDEVTIGFDNQKEDQMEYYTFPRSFFKFSIKMNQIIELIAEKRSGEYCIKSRQYKNDILEESNILNSLLDEDDDF